VSPSSEFIAKLNVKRFRVCQVIYVCVLIFGVALGHPRLTLSHRKQARPGAEKHPGSSPAASLFFSFGVAALEKG
jgi:hypothetical protein